MPDVIRTTLRALAVVAAVVSTPVVSPTPAAAQVSITVDIGRGTHLSSRRSITCSEGERLLRRRGFRDVRRVDCRGVYFVYRGARGSRRYEIAVSRRNGQIVDFRRIGRW